GFAILWLSASPRLYGTSRPALSSSPLSACQILLMVLGNLALLIGPASELIAQPGSPSAAVVHGGEIWAWLALLATLAAALWYAGRTLAEIGVHLLCLLGMALAVLAACTTAAAWDDGHWQAYHVLTAGWFATGLVVLA